MEPVRSALFFVSSPRMFLRLPKPYGRLLGPRVFYIHRRKNRSTSPTVLKEDVCSLLLQHASHCLARSTFVAPFSARSNIWTLRALSLTGPPRASGNWCSFGFPLIRSAGPSDSSRGIVPYLRREPRALFLPATFALKTTIFVLCPLFRFRCTHMASV